MTYREDWSVYLVARDPFAKPRKGPHGGIITARGHERITCPTCGSVGVWSSTHPAALYCPPPGHHIDRDEAGHMIRDTCPNSPERLP